MVYVISFLIIPLNYCTMEAHVPILFRWAGWWFLAQAAIVKISGEFPHLLQVRTGEKRRRSEEAMNFTFISYWSESHWGSPA